MYDPWASEEAANAEYGIYLISKPQNGHYDGVIIAVGHSQFVQMGADAIRALGKPVHVLYDLKYLLHQGSSDLRL